MRNISIGIDLGSERTRVVVGEFLRGEKYPKIIGLGESQTLGVRRGYVVDLELARDSVREALEGAEKSSELKITRAIISVSGTSLRGETSSGLAMVSKADGEVTNLDVKHALEECEDNLNLGNRKIVHVFPTSFRLDGKDVLGRPEGMRGTKLEAKALYVTYSSQHLEDLLEVMASAKVESTDVVASGVAAHSLVLSEKQKIVGTALVDIGAQTTKIAVYENGSLISLHTFSIGSEDITNDIALGFKIPLEAAEKLKLGDVGVEYSRKKLDEIIEARLSDIFELIENHFKKIKRNELLPAGGVFIGGGAHITGPEEFSKSALKLPSRVGAIEIFGSAKTKLRDPAWATALGLVIYGRDSDSVLEGSFFGVFKDIKNAIKANLKQLMP